MNVCTDANMVFIRKLLDDGQTIHYDPADKFKVMFEPGDKKSIVLEGEPKVKNKTIIPIMAKKLRPTEIIADNALFKKDFFNHPIIIETEQSTLSTTESQNVNKLHKFKSRLLN